MKQLQKLTIPLLALLALTACTISQLSISLAIVSDATTAATIAIPILETAGVVPAPIGNLILDYTAAVGDACSQSSTELLTADTAAIKSEKIIGYFATVAVPALGPTVGPEVAAIIKAIESAVNLFLSHFTTPHARAMIASGAVDGVKLSTGDRRAIGSLQKKFAATAAKARALKK